LAASFSTSPILQSILSSLSLTVFFYIVQVMQHILGATVENKGDKEAELRHLSTFDTSLTPPPHIDTFNV
jgi:hypothetical protein